MSRRMIDEKELKAQLEANALKAGKNITVEDKEINLDIPAPVYAITSTQRIRFDSGNYAVGDIKTCSNTISIDISGEQYKKYKKTQNVELIKPIAYTIKDSTSGIVLIPYRTYISSIFLTATGISISIKYSMICLVGGTSDGGFYSPTQQYGGYIEFLPL